MSPLGSPCPKLINHGSFYFCNDYSNRPKECMNHYYSFAVVCPIGLEILDIVNKEQIQERIDTGYAMLKYDIDSPSDAYNKLINASS